MELFSMSARTANLVCSWRRTLVGGRGVLSTIVGGRGVFLDRPKNPTGDAHSSAIRRRLSGAWAAVAVGVVDGTSAWKGRYAALPHGAGLAKHADLAPVVAGFGQDLVGVLPEQRRAARDVGRCSAHLDRRAQRSEA